MTEQEILIQMSEDPFDTKLVKVPLPNGVKVLKGKVYDLKFFDFLNEYSKHETSVSDSKSTIIDNGDIVTGTVESITLNEDKYIDALINVNPKYTVSCSLRGEPKEIVTQLEKGMELDVKVKLKSGKMSASIGDAMTEVKVNELINSISDKTTAYKCKVLELIHGGYWVDISGIKCFMPGSLAGLNKLYDFDMLLGNELIVMPVTFSKEKNTIVVSHREYLKTLIPNTIENLKETIKEKRNGFVTGTTDFGIFVEFDECLTGLIPKAELDELTIKFYNAREIKPGDSIDFWVKDLISNKKIILSQKGPQIDLWDEIEEKYKPMMITKGTVSKLTSYGMFVELEKGVSGLIHKSKIKDLTFNRGDNITIKITSVNVKDRKITMSLV